jgi:hypothetical protein
MIEDGFTGRLLECFLYSITVAESVGDLIRTTWIDHILSRFV